jgi:hypothetical protein
MATSPRTALIYWYGYDQPGEQAWAHTRLTALTRAPLWWGDVMVTGTSSTAGDLGRATTLGRASASSWPTSRRTQSAPAPQWETRSPTHTPVRCSPMEAGEISSSRPEPTAGQHERGVSGERRNATRTGRSARIVRNGLVTHRQQIFSDLRGADHFGVCRIATVGNGLRLA